jgi:hypothetical protein
MKITITSLELLAVCVLASCASSASIVSGDTKSKVRAKYGPPIEVKTGADGVEEWTYQSIRYHTLSRDTYTEALSLPNGPSWAPNADRDANLPTGTRTGVTTEVYREISKATVRFSQEGSVIPPIPQGTMLNTLKAHHLESGFMTLRD